MDGWLQWMTTTCGKLQVEWKVERCGKRADSALERLQLLIGYICSTAVFTAYNWLHPLHCSFYSL
jgi:hypothetical protein